MNIKQGDTVSVEGKESMIETSWGAGKHRAFKLQDGRVILDLDKLVASGKATVVSGTQEYFKPSYPTEVEEKPTFIKKWTS